MNEHKPAEATDEQVDNGRKSIRIQLQSRVFIELASPDVAGDQAGEIARCDILDVSRDGLQVALGQALPVGAILQIGAELPGSEEAFYLAGEVMWCRPREEALEEWCAGFLLLNARDSDISRWRELLQHV